MPFLANYHVFGVSFQSEKRTWRSLFFFKECMFFFVSNIYESARASEFLKMWFTLQFFFTGTSSIWKKKSRSAKIHIPQRAHAIFFTSWLEWVKQYSWMVQLMRFGRCENKFDGTWYRSSQRLRLKWICIKQQMIDTFTVSRPRLSKTHSLRDG